MNRFCFFIGHSDTPESVFPELKMAIEKFITEYGVREFRVGNYGRFDRMAARAVQESKSQYPDIKLYLVLPYLPEQGRKLPDMAGYDGSIYPEGMENVPYKFAISHLNHLMVQEASHVIAYVVRSYGGAANTLKQAHRREKKNELILLNIGCPHKISLLSEKNIDCDGSVL